jgi:hypothetical protein
MRHRKSTGVCLPRCSSVLLCSLERQSSSHWERSGSAATSARPPPLAPTRAGRRSRRGGLAGFPALPPERRREPRSCWPPPASRHSRMPFRAPRSPEASSAGCRASGTERLPEGAQSACLHPPHQVEQAPLRTGRGLERGAPCRRRRALLRARFPRHPAVRRPRPRAERHLRPRLGHRRPRRLRRPRPPHPLARAAPRMTPRAEPSRQGAVRPRPDRRRPLSPPRMEQPRQFPTRYPKRRMRHQSRRRPVRRCRLLKRTRNAAPHQRPSPRLPRPPR